MHTLLLTKYIRTPLTAIACAASLAACGGAEINAPETVQASPLVGATSSSPTGQEIAATVQSSETGTSQKRVGTPPTHISTVPYVPTYIAGAITDVIVENTGGQLQQNVPLTFGQVFAPGHVTATEALSGQLADGTVVPFQVDVKARHPDGSLRHAIISAKLPTLAAGAAQQIGIMKATAAPAPLSAATPAALLAAGFTSTAKITLGGVVYTAAVHEQMAAGKYTSWLAGSIVNEWLVSVPLKTAQGTVHPHLSARFAIRAVQGSAQARVDVTIENNWAYEPAPQNFTYDAQIMVGGAAVYTKAALTHAHHSRWRKVFWWGAQPQTHVRHNTNYLIASKAVPNYDRTIVTSEAQLAAIKSGWTGAKTEPMAYGLALPAMGAGGGRPDIGLLPGWTVTYLLTMDSRAKEAAMGTADLSGSWPAHYRDKKTDRPVSLADYPYMTILGGRGDTLNPATGKLEAFPLCATTTACTAVGTPITSHLPSFSYVPYLVSGDHYHLEELQFWAMWSVFSSNPHYRGFGQGLVKDGQIRSQAWSMRTLAQVSYITPDSDPLKSQFTNILNNNFNWYNANYSNSATAPQLGFMHIGTYTMPYNGGLGISPWMDDFFTQAIGHANELGFTNAKPLLVWKTRFPVARMSAPGTCWIDGAIYAMNVRATVTGPLYKTMAEIYKANHTSAFAALGCNSVQMASSLSLKVGEMTGYSYSNLGYPSNMQPALAYAADVAGAAGVNAWGMFNARSVKPDYSSGPQFAIVPR